MSKLESDKYRSGQKALTHKELDKLMEVIDNIEDELLIILAVTTGLRREDLCSVKTKNIDLQEGTLTFHESKKNKDRTIYLSPKAVTLISKFLKTQEKRDNLFSFCGRTAYRHFNYWCRIAKIPERPFHALRATCTKFCHDAGWTDPQISDLTGDSIRVIQQHYMTPSRGEMKQAAQEKPII